jgi:hypothetical protein
MKFEGKPKAVQQARFEDNRAALSAMGKAGAIKAAESKRKKADKEEQEKAALEEVREYHLEKEFGTPKTESLSEDGDVLPPH